MSLINFFIEFAETVFTMTSKTGARSKLMPVKTVLEENQDQDIEVLSISDVLHVDIPSENIQLLQKLHLDDDSSKEMHNLGSMVAMKTTDETCWMLWPLLSPARPISSVCQ